MKGYVMARGEDGKVARAGIIDNEGIDSFYPLAEVSPTVLGLRARANAHRYPLIYVAFMTPAVMEEVERRMREDNACAALLYLLDNAEVLVEHDDGELAINRLREMVEVRGRHINIDMVTERLRGEK